MVIFPWPRSVYHVRVHHTKYMKKLLTILLGTHVSASSCNGYLFRYMNNNCSIQYSVSFWRGKGVKAVYRESHKTIVSVFKTRNQSWRPSSSSDSSVWWCQGQPLPNEYLRPSLAVHLLYAVAKSSAPNSPAHPFGRRCDGARRSACRRSWRSWD